MTKVLVDGKEFFGSDPKVATKNLPADAIDKVQVFDKLSDMSEFTGVDDGEQTRTINLALKKDRKNGFFGDVSVGAGSNTDVSGGFEDAFRFRGKSNINRFSEKSQFSFLGMGNNINEQAFSIDDYINFVGGAQNLMGGGRGGAGSGGLSPSDLGISRWGNGAQAKGISTSAAGGLNFNTEIGKKLEWSSSYFYNFLQKNYSDTTLRETIFDSETLTSADTTEQQDQNQNHRLNLRLKYKIDSTSQAYFQWSGNLEYHQRMGQFSKLYFWRYRWHQPIH